MAAYPWTRLGLNEILRVFHSAAWAGELTLPDFERVLSTLLGTNPGAGAVMASKLFNCFDQDQNGRLSFREVFIGLMLI